MKVYIGHSTRINYREDLYRPLKQSELAEEHELVFPHESEDFFSSREFLQEECDLVVAEVSKASTGLGIELGWASLFEVPVICVFRSGSNPSRSLKAVTDNFVEYSSKGELVSKLESEIDF
jgi:nucleoside 2-deoxyribosyltransferase